MVPHTFVNEIFTNDLLETAKRFITMSFQRPSSDGQDTYPGCRAIIRTAFVIRGAPEAAAVFMLRSLAESTMNQ